MQNINSLGTPSQGYDANVKLDSILCDTDNCSLRDYVAAILKRNSTLTATTAYCLQFVRRCENLTGRSAGECSLDNLSISSNFSSWSYEQRFPGYWTVVGGGREG